MKLLLSYDGSDYVLDVTPEQFQDLRKKLAARFAALRKLKLPIPDYTMANLDAPKRFITSRGVISKTTAVTTKVTDLKL